MTYFLIGAFYNNKTLEEAEVWQTCFQPSVIRKNIRGKFDFYQLSRDPITPKQEAFVFLDTDTKWLID